MQRRPPSVRSKEKCTRVHSCREEGNQLKEEGGKGEEEEKEEKEERGKEEEEEIN